MNNSVKDIKRGVQTDKESTEELIKKVEPLIYACYRKYQYACDSPEDAYQDSIVILLDSIVSYDEDKRLPFIVHFKNGLFYHYMKKVKKSKADRDRKEYQSFDEFQGMLVDETPGFDLDMIHDEDLIGLRSGFEKLAEKHMWILTEYYMKDRKLKDLAREKGMHVQSLVKLKRRALDHLRKQINIH